MIPNIKVALIALVLISTVQADEPSKMVRRATNVETGKSITTYDDGWVVTITPGEPGPSNVETFLGVPLTPITYDSSGAYDRKQNADVDKARAYNLEMARINAINQRRSTVGNGGRIRTGRIGPVNNTKVIIRNR